MYNDKCIPTQRQAAIPPGKSRIGTQLRHCLLHDETIVHTPSPTCQHAENPLFASRVTCTYCHLLVELDREG